MLEGVDNVKGKLEAKLAEIGGLIQELGNVQKIIDTQRTQRRRSINRSSPKRSPDQRNWKNALTLPEVTGGADGRLPPIVEDKYFPRRTMEYVIFRIQYFDAYYSLVLKNCLESSRILPTLLIRRTLGRHLLRISTKEIRSNLIPHESCHPAADQPKASKKRSQSFRPTLRLERRDGRALIEEIRA